MAEERALRYLPARLTFAVIADKLGISRSVAKERELGLKRTIRGNGAVRPCRASNVGVTLESVFASD